MSAEVRHLLNSITRRLADLQTFQLPRLRECTGPPDLVRELVEEMRGDLEGVRYNLELAREMSESLSRTEKEASAHLIEQMEREYDERAYRGAMLESRSKRAISSRSRVHELKAEAKSKSGSGSGSGSTKEGDGPDGSPAVVGDTDNDNRAKNKDAKGKARSAAEFGMGGDDELQTKTNEVTTALRRTTALMQNELERSVLSVQMLDSSSKTLRSTNDLYTRYTALLETSSSIVKQLEKADTMDRVLILCALLFFLLVVGFVIKRRVLDRTVGVVLGGVGRGVGWYLFGTGRLLRVVLGGKVGKPVAVEGYEEGAGGDAGVRVGELRQPGVDSAVIVRSEGEGEREGDQLGEEEEEEQDSLAEPSPGDVGFGDKYVDLEYQQPRPKPKPDDRAGTLGIRRDEL